MRHLLLASLPLFALACRIEGTRLEKGDTAEGLADDDDDGFTTEEGDCDDENAAIGPAATEVCDNVDNNCDGAVDEGLGGLWFPDADGDGFGDPALGLTACEPPSTSYILDGTDCDDARADVYPAAPELCDTVDNDCDTEIDEDGTTAWYADVDQDGYGDPGAEWITCQETDAGWVADNTDCDDSTEAVFPGHPELCDLLDNNCDGAVDEGVTTTYFVDVDADAYGVDGLTLEACSHPTGYADVGGDCDDAEANVNPAAVEVCNGMDDDCDGYLDGDDPDVDASTGALWYADADGDSYGDSGTAVWSCDAPKGYLADDTDCDDTDAAVNPAATEVCNEIDDDCDGAVDDADASVDLGTAALWYADADGDSYGEAASVTAACDAPAGYAADDTDCDDTDPAVNPAATEVCNEIDDDCDGAVDDADASVDLGTATEWYADADGDGYGDAASGSTACDAPAGHLGDDTDCDDTDSAVNPGATEVCNEIDDDCDGAVDDADASVDLATGTDWYVDGDGDGYGDPASVESACDAPAGTVAAGTDCDDTDPAVSPAASELCNEVDDDCDGAIDSGTGIWSDDFDDNDISDWSIVDGSWSVASGIISGSSVSHTGPDLVHTTGMSASTDSYTVYMTGAGGHGFGIVLGYGSATAHCGFHFYGNTTLYLVNSSTEEKNVGSLSYTTGTYYDVVAEVSPGNVDLRFGGTLVYSGDAGCDAFTRTGEIGLQVHVGPTAYFDSICVEY